MKQQEKQLFQELCAIKAAPLKEELLAHATPVVLGLLFFHRMAGTAYCRMKAAGVLGKVNREFRNSLAAAYEQNREKNESYFSGVAEIAEMVKKSGRPVAMLKGAYLCRHYPEGCRTSNDIDLLLMPEDVSAVGTLLSEAGFRQGQVRNGEFVPASRREIIESKMMRGETVPYIKEVALPFMRFLEVDLNFSLDYKPSDTEVLSGMLARVSKRAEKGLLVPTLAPEDFFLHLCAHLYKEATTLPWIEMKRDMTLYKYADIALLLSEMTEKEVFAVFSRAEELGMERLCAYAVLETVALFGMDKPALKTMAEQRLGGERDFLLLVTAPKEQKRYRYRTRDALERFFMEDRKKDLEEVSSNADA